MRTSAEGAVGGQGKDGHLLQVFDEAAAEQIHMLSPALAAGHRAGEGG